MISILGILLAVTLLIYTCYKGIPAVIVEPLVSILVLITSGMDVASGMSGEYMAGMSFILGYSGVSVFSGILYRNRCCKRNV